MDKILIAINRTRRKSVYITSLIKYRHKSNRNPLLSEISCCKEHLKEQIQILKPKMILMLGNVVPKFLLKKDFPTSNTIAKIILIIVGFIYRKTGLSKYNVRPPNKEMITPPISGI